MMERAPHTVEELVRALDRREVIRRCGVTTSAVSNWIAEGSIPVGRYFQLRALCNAKGVPVPEHLFGEVVLEPGE